MQSTFTFYIPQFLQMKKIKYEIILALGQRYTELTYTPSSPLTVAFKL